MRIQRLASVSAGIVLAVALAGCSSAITGVTGLTVTGGRVTALVGMCTGVTADEVHMTPSGGQFFLIPHPSWRFEKSQVAEVDLGEVEDFLSRVGDRTMGFQSAASSGVGGYIRFDASDIQELADGEILASTATSADHDILDATGFERAVDDLCSNY